MFSYTLKDVDDQAREDEFFESREEWYRKDNTRLRGAIGRRVVWLVVMTLISFVGWYILLALAMHY